MDLLPKDVLRMILFEAAVAATVEQLLGYIMVCKSWRNVWHADPSRRRQVLVALKIIEGRRKIEPATNRGRDRGPHFATAWIANADEYELFDWQRRIVGAPEIPELGWEYVVERVVDGEWYMKLQLWMARRGLDDDPLRNLCRSYLILYNPAERDSLEAAGMLLARLRDVLDRDRLETALLVGIVLHEDGALETSLEEAKELAGRICKGQAVWCRGGSLDDGYDAAIRALRRQQNMVPSEKIHNTATKKCTLM